MTIIGVAGQRQAGTNAYVKHRLTGLDIHTVDCSTLAAGKGLGGQRIVKIRLEIVDQLSFGFLHSGYELRTGVEIKQVKGPKYRKVKGAVWQGKVN